MHATSDVRHTSYSIAAKLNNPFTTYTFRTNHHLQRGRDPSVIPPFHLPSPVEKPPIEIHKERGVFTLGLVSVESGTKCAVWFRHENSSEDEEVFHGQEVKSSVVVFVMSDKRMSLTKLLPRQPPQFVCLDHT